ncbi:hypothetical protein HMPREF1326_01150 [Akkermansia sp. KLE1605]|nr:hypothetical protein HMPREF1326_01150 [Akkermansia sp. KLE1605]
MLKCRLPFWEAAFLWRFEKGTLPFLQPGERIRKEIWHPDVWKAVGKVSGVADKCHRKCFCGAFRGRRRLPDESIGFPLFFGSLRPFSGTF